ncbi:glycosyltransferase involved in cell wall biosynthesis [Elusimicrobium posterum]|uniref:glycosyltransferase family 2 protein n=1 Tax=Elusimicrobium posterum TaxID=3116653 RepID=UPI003C7187A6
MSAIKLSIVVPVYNESGNIEELFAEIVNVCAANSYEYEVIFVDDGSSDGSYEKAQNLKPLKYIRMRKNFGQSAAMDAGIKAAINDYIVTMDGDRQNNPADIPMMLDYMIKNNCDIVSGWRKNRKDTFSKRFASRGANFLRSVFVKDNIHDSGCSLKVYKRECFEGFNLYGEMHRFIPALLMLKGFKTGEVVVDHRARTCGVTKYNWKRVFNGFVDMVSIFFWRKYSARPLHLLGTCGIFMFLFGALSILISAGFFIASNYLYATAALLVFFMFMLSGIFCFVSGVMTDILIKIYYGDEINTPYSIKDTFENK